MCWFRSACITAQIDQTLHLSDAMRQFLLDCDRPDINTKCSKFLDACGIDLSWCMLHCFDFRSATPMVLKSCDLASGEVSGINTCRLIYTNLDGFTDKGKWIIT